MSWKTDEGAIQWQGSSQSDWRGRLDGSVAEDRIRSCGSTRLNKVKHERDAFTFLHRSRVKHIEV
jgi:hypothetical protein